MSGIETRYGRLTVLDADTDTIARFLVRYGEWAWCEAVFVASVIEDGARVLDVGAFAGTFGLGVALSRPLSFLCFVEANPAVARLLEGNVAGKARCPVAVINAMVAGPGAGPRAGRSEPGNLGATSFCLNGGTGDEVPGTVRAVTLADLRAQHGTFNLIKLDVEGMELEALHGDADHLAKGETTLWIECNEDRRSLAVARLLLTWNLDLFYFAFPSHNSANFNGASETVFPWAFEAGLLVAPMTHPSLTADLQNQGCILRALHSLDDLKDALWRTPRWGMLEWEGATSKEELAALVGRALCEESFDSFLKEDGPTAPDKAQTVWQRLEVSKADLSDARLLLDEERGQRGRIEDCLRQANEVVLARLGEIAGERERREMVEEGLWAAEKLALERFDQLNAERERREQLEDRLRQAEALAAERLVAADEERDRREQLKDRLRQAEALVAERLVAAEQEREQTRSAEAELAKASTRALLHLSALGEARDRASMLEEKLRAERAAIEAERMELQEASKARMQALEARARA